MRTTPYVSGGQVMAADRLYHIKNWTEYNRSLVRRGNITVWFSQSALDGWVGYKTRLGRGRHQEYSDAGSNVAWCFVHYFACRLERLRDLWKE